MSKDNNTHLKLPIKICVQKRYKKQFWVLLDIKITKILRYLCRHLEDV